MINPFGKDYIFIRKLNEIILANLGNENFGVKELAQELGMSQYRLRRRLQKSTSKSINQFIREIRLHRALEMLQNEEITSSEVAYKVGFSSPSYFNTCFNGFFGYPPGKVKKEDSDNNGNNPPIQTKSEQQQERSFLKTIILPITGILLLTIVVLLGYVAFLKNSPTDSFAPLRDNQKSIVVLPFKNLSDSLNQYFIDGLMEEILTNLSRIHDLKVISLTSAGQFHESYKSTPQIGKDLNVDYIVEGSGKKYDNAFRLTVNLIETARDKHIWEASYENEVREAKEIFKIQSEVAQRIASEIKASITPEEKRRIEALPTTKLMAYDFYQRGREDHRKYWADNSNKQALKRAEEMYNKAFQCDSTYARVYIGFADVFWDKNYYESYYSKNFLDSVLILADQALSFDPYLAEGYFYRAHYCKENGRSGESIKEFDKAILYNPNYWEAYFGKANVYLFNNDYLDYVKGLEALHKAANINHGKEFPELLRMLGWTYYYNAGFLDKAKYYCGEAYILDGDSITYLSTMGGIEIMSGNYDKGIALTKKCYALDSNNIKLLNWLANQYFYNGYYKESLMYFKKYIEKLKLQGQFPQASQDQRNIGYAFWKNGFKKESELWFNELRRIAETSIKLGRDNSNYGGLYYDLASLYAFIEEKENAFELLRKLNRKSIFSFYEVVLIKKYDPLFNSIRNEPEFQRIVNDMEAKYQAEHERVRRWLEKNGQL